MKLINECKNESEIQVYYQRRNQIEPVTITRWLETQSTGELRLVVSLQMGTLRCGTYAQ